MARQEKPLDPDAGPVQGFAWALRAVRRQAGQPTYRTLSQKAGYSASTLSEAAAGERLPSLPVTLGYITACGADPAEWEERWRSATAAVASCPVVDEAAEPPYRGLARYEPRDAALFFGRDQLTCDLLELVRHHRFTALSGPSGSGKSSLLRAGLLPALQQENTGALCPAALRILTPGPRPTRTHAVALVPKEDVAGDTVVIVDQFEELFTLCADPVERAGFLGHLLAARSPDSRLRVVIAVRADFLGRCAEQPDLADALRGTLLLAGPLNRDELRQAIVAPAQASGLIVERALTARILAEVDGEPGGLPLMSHALLETWRRRQGRTLTEAAYEAAGGLHGAIARTAEDCYTGLTPHQAALARSLLLRLIAPGDGTPDTRRPTPRAELALGNVTDSATVLECLTRARLITADESTVELAHEALITAWPRLDAWLVTERDRLRIRRWLTDAALAWHGLDRDPGALYRGIRLASAENTFPAATRQDDLTRLEADFLTASALARDREQRAAARAARRQRRFTAIVAVLVTAVLIAGAIAWVQHRTSDQQYRQATAAQQTILSRRLAAQATDLMGTNPTLASLLAVHAYHARPTAEATTSLRAAAALPHQRHLSGHRAVFSLAFSPDGRTLATAGDEGRVRLWDVTTGKIRTTLNTTDRRMWTVAFSPDGRTLATGGDAGRVRLWNMASNEIRVTLPGTDSAIESMAFSPDGHTLATAAGVSGIRLWDITTGRTRKFLIRSSAFGYSVAFNRNGRIAAIHGDDQVRLWNAATGKTRTTLNVKDPTRMVFSPDGRTLAIGGSGSQIPLWDVAAGKVRTTLSDSSLIESMAYAPKSSTLAIGSWDGVRLWDTALPTEPREAIRTICRAIGRDLTPKERSIYLPGQPFHRTCAPAP